MDKNYRPLFFYFFLAVSAIMALYLLYLLVDIIIILAISVLIAFIFNPFINLFEKAGLNRLTSVLLVFLSISCLLFLLMSFIIPAFILQMNALLESMKIYPLHEQIIKIEHDIYKVLPFFKPGEFAARVESFISTQLLNSFNLITPFVSSIVSVIALMVIIPFIAFFLLKDSDKIMRSLISIAPNKYFEMTYWIAKRITIQLGHYVRAWIFDATFVGVTMGLGLYIIGVPYSLPLGVIAGVGHLIPYFGPVIGGVPAIIISIIQFGDLSHVPLIALLLVLIYTFDNGFVQPYIFSKNLDIHPIIIILLIVAGGQLFGVLGMMLIIPVTTVIRTAVKEFYFAFRNYNIARL